MDQDAFECKFPAFDEVFHLHELILLIVEAGDLRICQQRLDTPERGREFVRMVGADDAAAGRESERLEYTRIFGARGCRMWAVGKRDALEFGHQQSGRAESLVRKKFIAAGEDGVGRIVRSE